MNYQLPTNSFTNFENKLKISNQNFHRNRKRKKTSDKKQNSHKTKQDGEDGYLTVLPM